MPRESKMNPPPHNVATKNAMLVVSHRYEYDHKKGESVPIPQREKAVDALSRWGDKIELIVDAVVQFKDISMSEVRDLENISDELKTAAQSMSGKVRCQ